MEKRAGGLDLVRVLALLLVVTFHSFLNNGYYGEAQTGVAMWLAGSARWLSVCCIGLFLMLTGYFKGTKTDMRSCYRGLGSVLLGYVLAAVVSIPVRHFLLGDAQSFSVWVSRFFGFRGVYYGWYVEMYVGLTLLSPFVNLLLERLDSRKLLGLSGVMVALTALPGATALELAPDHWRSLYPFTYYILGAAVRRLQPKLHPGLGILGAVGIAFGLGAVTVCSTDGMLSDGFLQEFGDLWIAVMVVLLFVGLYRVKPGESWSRILTFAAGGCYGGYLLSHLLDGWCYRLAVQWRRPEKYPLLFLLVTIPIFLVSLLGGRALEEATKLLLRRRKERKT